VAGHPEERSAVVAGHPEKAACGPGKQAGYMRFGTGLYFKSVGTQRSAVVMPESSSRSRACSRGTSA
jgi:hypothetical protein